MDGCNLDVESVVDVFVAVETEETIDVSMVSVVLLTFSIWLLPPLNKQHIISIFKQYKFFITFINIQFRSINTTIYVFATTKTASSIETHISIVKFCILSIKFLLITVIFFLVLA